MKTLILEQLIHNGILVTEPQLPGSLGLVIRGERRELSAKQMEMAIAWAKKQGTPYVEDSVFARNFMRDFSQALGVRPRLAVDEVDFGPANRIVQAERAARERLTKEERKELAAQRKVKREELRDQYGFATVNGERVEIANYVAEPSSIFMGRGKHPLRGRWKEGPRQSDISINLSPDAPTPEGTWAEIVWQPESLWVARWRDKLSEKLKYVWLSDAAPIKQEREAAQFDQAVELDENLALVQSHITHGLRDPNPRRRKVATACYLIDALSLRVGDEKDADEADTVGATTLRPEHVTLHADGEAEFRFLGKDSVLWHKTVSLPDIVQQNLEELLREARPSNSALNGGRHPSRDRPQIFPDIRSSSVNNFLSEVLPGLTAKVFRTHHATQTMHESLEAADLDASSPEYEKWGAVSLANLEAAVVCNHYKAAPANWSERRQRAKERQIKLQERVEKYRDQAKEAKRVLAETKREAREKREAAKTHKQREKVKERNNKKLERARKKVETARARLERARTAQSKTKTRDTVASRKRTWNLTTSLKSYIDPRVVHEWGQKVDYDVLTAYYPKALQRKFAWVRSEEPECEDPAPATKVSGPK